MTTQPPISSMRSDSAQVPPTFTSILAKHANDAKPWLHFEKLIRDNLAQIYKSRGVRFGPVTLTRTGTSGIDHFTMDANGERWSIQAKLYGEKYYVSEPDLASFIAHSKRSDYHVDQHAPGHLDQPHRAQRADAHQQHAQLPHDAQAKPREHSRCGEDHQAATAVSQSVSCAATMIGCAAATSISAHGPDDAQHRAGDEEQRGCRRPYRLFPGVPTSSLLLLVNLLREVSLELVRSLALRLP
jgi:hypothetical protein